MELALEHRALWVLLFVFIVLTLAAFLEGGRRLRLRAEKREGGEVEKGLGALEAALFSLLALLLAFTFASAAGRFDARRQLVVDESNALGTAYLRLGLVPAEYQPALRERFRAYVDARIAGNAALPDARAARAHLRRATEMQEPLWTAAVAACAEAEDSRAAILLLPALNASFDLAASRMAMFLMHPPPFEFVLLMSLAMLCSAVAGWSLGAAPRPRRLHTLGYLFSLSLTLYLTLEIELPRYGLITTDTFDSVLVEARERMK